MITKIQKKFVPVAAVGKVRQPDLVDQPKTSMNKSEKFKILQFGQQNFQQYWSRSSCHWPLGDDSQPPKIKFNNDYYCIEKITSDFFDFESSRGTISMRKSNVSFFPIAMATSFF